MSTTTVSLEDAVLEAAAHLYVWALKDARPPGLCVG